MEHKGKIGESSVTVAMGDITKHVVDAYIVPQFTSCASFGGVGGAIARSGGEQGLNLYDQHVQANGEQQFGSALVTKSGGGNSKSLIHVVSVGSDRDQEFDTVRSGFLNALKEAQSHGFTKIAAPAMGTGIIGQLTGEQSAKAMMSALDEFMARGGKSMDVSFVIYGDQQTFKDFTNVLQTRSYEAAKSEEGQRDFNPGRFVAGMNADLAANAGHTGLNPKRDPLTPDGTGHTKH